MKNKKEQIKSDLVKKLNASRVKFNKAKTLSTQSKYSDEITKELFESDIKLTKEEFIERTTGLLMTPNTFYYIYKAIKKKKY